MGVFFGNVLLVPGVAVKVIEESEFVFNPEIDEVRGFVFL